MQFFFLGRSWSFWLWRHGFLGWLFGAREARTSQWAKDAGDCGAAFLGQFEAVLEEFLEQSGNHRNRVIDWRVVFVLAVVRASFPDHIPSRGIV